ncbi:hypothetical protein WN55_11117 [Dufourea novaeangliae]|uniref:Uncharacterized protein n=1 Tax=Dufourea novaeangliae TaxID=178035 RepID=A0A154PDB3_DUFNO|nr:hypothetical protein WN55_11117 [Dufourea novaeangliae]
MAALRHSCQFSRVNVALKISRECVCRVNHDYSELASHRIGTYLLKYCYTHGITSMYP